MNYQNKMEEILESISDETPRLLLHCCCAPCCSYTLELLSNYFEITLYYYNPNIHPENEYTRRLQELQDFIKKFKTKNRVELVEENYDTGDYFDKIKGLESLGEGSKRCFECYKFRMEKGASYAKKHNFDYFTTTLSISPYKNSTWINEIGEYLENKYDIKYLFCDLKKKNGFKRSLELSKIYGLYRQDYCGCIYSKQERESKKVTHESV